MNVYMYIYFTLFTEEQTAKVLLIVTMCLGMFWQYWRLDFRPLWTFQEWGPRATFLINRRSDSRLNK